VIIFIKKWLFLKKAYNKLPIISWNQHRCHSFIYSFFLQERRHNFTTIAKFNQNNNGPCVGWKNICIYGILGKTCVKLWCECEWIQLRILVDFLLISVSLVWLFMSWLFFYFFCPSHPVRKIYERTHNKWLNVISFFFFF
jgi:hypothetical protein